jgi:hypothetical protein
MPHTAILVHSIFNYLKTHIIYGKSVLDAECVFQFSLQLCSKHFSLINIWQVTLQMHAETDVGVYESV